MATSESREVGIDHLTVVPENLPPDGPKGDDADATADGAEGSSA